MADTHVALTLFSDYLLVRPLADVPDAGGIINPYGRHANDPQRAEVLAAGPGYITVSGDLVPNPCAVGDTVILQFNAGTDIKLRGETLKMVMARDLFGKET